MHISIRKNKDKFLRRGYPWVFKNIVEKVVGSPSTGDIVGIQDADGEALGCGLFHSESAIMVRFLSHLPPDQIGDSFFRERIIRAISFRNSVLPNVTHRRIIYGESDGLPGTIVDQYGDVLTWTTLSAGIEMRRDLFLDTLAEALQPRAIVERNDVSLRRKDGLSEATGILRGQLDAPVEIVEDGLKFSVDVLGGPKTGFFIDQRFNRLALRTFSAGRTVLDPFCADGGFGLHAAYAGARHVDLADISANAIARASANAEANGLGNVSFETHDALDWLGSLVDAGNSYDLVVLDPPAFAKSKRNVDDATRAYQRVNINALQLLPEGGILATSSCSQAISESDFLRIVTYAARKVECGLRLLYRGSGSPDHPTLTSMPETDYLKFFVFQKMGDESP